MPGTIDRYTVEKLMLPAAFGKVAEKALSVPATRVFMIVD